MTTGIWSSSYNPPDFAQKSFGLNITRLRPTGMTTLLALTSLFQGETAKQIEHGFWTEALIFPELELSANAAAGDALLTVVSTENILPNMVFQTTGTIATSRENLIVDSIVFLWLAFGSLDFLAGQVVGKAWMVLLSIPLVAWLRRRDARVGLVAA